MVDVRKFNSKLAIVLVLLFAYVTRVWRLSIPADYYFDEVYHAFTARAYANNDPRGYEWWHTAPEGVAYEWLHPPLAKLFQGFSIYILGENSFAWRFPSAVFGVLTVWAVYELTFELSKKKSWAVIAAMIASFDGLLLTLSRIAMNDIFVTFFILMTLKWYFRFSDSRNKNDKCKALFWSSIFAGLALASKWSGIYLLMIVGLWEIYLRWQQLLTNKTIWLLKVCLALVLLVCAGWVLLFLKLESVLYVKYLMTTLLLAIDLVLWVRIFSLKRVIQLSIAFVLVPIAIYWLSYGQWWLQGHTLVQFKELHRQIWWYQTNLEATHPYQSTPLEWIFNLKPVWFYVKYGETGTVGNIYALANPAIAWLGLVAAVWMLITSWGQKTFSNAKRFLVLAYCCLWVPWLMSPRIMFFYHYTPAMASLTVILAMMFGDWWRLGKIGKGFSVVTMLLFAGLFVYFFPHWTGYEVPSEWSNHYFWLKSWK